jgi:hypothetical protein
MTAPIPVTVAPNFHLPDAPAGRLLVADGAGWRPLSEHERSALLSLSAAPDPLKARVLLFALPGHLRSSFWEMLEQGGAAAGFDACASEVGRFLAFKQLAPPEGAVFELVLHGAGGRVEPGGLWAVVNLGDDPVVVGVPGLRVRLGAGEGCQLPEEASADIVPPGGDAPDALLVVRRPGRNPAPVSPCRSDLTATRLPENHGTGP